MKQFLLSRQLLQPGPFDLLSGFFPASSVCCYWDTLTIGVAVI
jgi:hypothetical protein